MNDSKSTAAPTAASAPIASTLLTLPVMSRNPGAGGGTESGDAESFARGTSSTFKRALATSVTGADAHC